MLRDFSRTLVNEHPSQARASAPNPRILVIDDYPSVRFTLDFYLNSVGFAVVTAEDGPSGLAIAAGGNVDLILLDLDLPSMCGLAVARQIAADPGLRRIPVIILTGRAGPSVEGDGIAAGARAVVRKPFDLHELEALIRRTLIP